MAVACCSSNFGNGSGFSSMDLVGVDESHVASSDRLYVDFRGSFLTSPLVGVLSLLLLGPFTVSWKPALGVVS